MITLTIHDKDALHLLAVLQTVQKLGLPDENGSADRVKSQLRCGLLLCDCDRVSEAKSIKSEDCRP